jgi:hypothetical protein
VASGPLNPTEVIQAACFSLRMRRVMLFSHS